MQRLRATNLSTAGHALRDSARTSSSKFSAREGYGKASTRTSLRRSYRACSKLSVPSEGEMEPVSPLLMKALQTKRRPVEAPAHISTGTGLAAATYRHRDWAHPAHVSTGTRLAAATSAPGLAPPPPHLRRTSVATCPAWFGSCRGAYMRVSEVSVEMDDGTVPTRRG
jgi:hypothetical protein